MARPWQSPPSFRSAYVEARRRWVQAVAPVTHFAQGHTTAPTYGIELDLEHQRSYVRALLDAYAEGNPHIDYAMRARADLVELTRLRDTLAHSGASTDAQTAILAYVALMDTAVREFIVQVETVPVPHARPIAP